MFKTLLMTTAARFAPDTEGQPTAADPAAAPQPEADDADTEAASQAEGEGEQLLDDDGNPIEGDDDSEEVEHEGKKARIPKWLKPALLFQQDYTKKTQAVAEEAKAFAAEREQFQKITTEQFQDIGRLVAVDQQLAAFKELNWDAINAADPGEHSRLFRQFTLLKDSREELARGISERHQQQALVRQRENAKQIEEGNAELARHIPNWGKETATKLVDFAKKTYGLPPERVAGYQLPGEVRMAHDAYLWRQHQSKQRAAVKPPEADPVPQVSARRSPVSPLSDKAPVEDWFKARNAQLAKKRQAR